MTRVCRPEARRIPARIICHNCARALLIERHHLPEASGRCHLRKPWQFADYQHHKEVEDRRKHRVPPDAFWAGRTRCHPYGFRERKLYKLWRGHGSADDFTASFQLASEFPDGATAASLHKAPMEVAASRSGEREARSLPLGEFDFATSARLCS